MTDKVPPQSNESKTNNSEITLDDKKYQNAELKGPSNALPAPSAKDEAEMKKVREEIEALKDYIVKKYKFIKAVGIIPPQAAAIFDEENELSEEEKKKKPMHLAIVIADDKHKKFNEVKVDIIKQIAERKQNVWLNLFLEKDLWEICMDSKYEVSEAIGMSYPLYDKGILGALRVAQIHKSLVLKKFEKYVYSYIIAGSLVRGEAIKTSDVDVTVIIDDTDVKRMPRLELKEKLRNIIYSYIMQATELAGVKNELNVQIWLLTEFWDGVKDANPVFYTFLRDGVPLYDRGGFLPWKLLLKMGKIKPSPESIDMFMSMGDKMGDMAKRKLLDIVMNDIYWGTITPTQGLLMMYGIPPTNLYETVSEMKKIFVDKEKLLEKKYWDILDEILIKYYKGYEHQKIKEVDGKTVDRLLKNAQSYLKRLKELRIDIEKRMQEKTFEELYENAFKLLKSIFGNKSEAVLVKVFEKELINNGKINPKYLDTLKSLEKIKKKYKEKKVPDIESFEKIRRDAIYLIDGIVEYTQRKELGMLQKSKITLTFKNKSIDLFLTKPMFLVDGSSVQKIGDKIETSNMQELNEAVQRFKGARVRLDKKTIALIKKELGEFDIHLD
jgi:predicted nucleotidyltransferase